MHRFLTLGSAAIALLTLASAASLSAMQTYEAQSSAPAMATAPPDSDPRIGLRAGLHDAEQALSNMRLVSATPVQPPFAGVSNSDLAFMGNYVFQGNYNGFQVWDISDPAHPVLRKGYLCPASQSDVSVYKNLLFVSGEGLSGRLDCGTQGVQDSISADRLRGLRIFDISDLDNPRNVGNVQTCRGSHTHSVLVDPKDPENVYVYISGASGVRSPSEMPGCSAANPDMDPNSALFRIEVIKVPLDHPEQAAIVSSPRIFNDLEAPPTHGEAPEDTAAREAEVAEAKRTGGYTVMVQGVEQALPSQFAAHLLNEVVKERGGTGAPTAADSAKLRTDLPAIITRMFGDPNARTGPTQCHDITVYPEIGLAGGACGGYGLLLDISDPVHPVRVAAVADSNFSYWHSATFNADGSKMLFSDEWGGGSAPKCRATDPMEWGADAIFTRTGNELTFESYYKLPVVQTPQENCVAHNGSMIPIPGRDVMAQAWYQGGISVFDWTDPSNPVEIAFFDRGPADSTQLAPGGSWSIYWYNGYLVSSEIARGLDILELTPSEHLTQNEIDAANTVRLDYLNVQGQPRYVWPPSFALAKAYLDQLERSNGLDADRIEAAREALEEAEGSSGQERRKALTELASELEEDAAGASDEAKVRTLAAAVADLADTQS
ncbi:MAG: LVIVD repeat-containing protein [Gemmatimonadota bacterium]